MLRTFRDDRSNFGPFNDESGDRHCRLKTLHPRHSLIEETRFFGSCVLGVRFVSSSRMLMDDAKRLFKLLLSDQAGFDRWQSDGLRNTSAEWKCPNYVHVSAQIPTNNPKVTDIPLSFQFGMFETGSQAFCLNRYL